MIRLFGSAGLLIVIASSVAAQSTSSGPSFEVASIKPRQQTLERHQDYDASGTRLTITDYSVIDLIYTAYQLQSYEVLLAPSVPRLDDTRYDVVAKGPGDRVPTMAEFRQMLQALLAERFGLKVHRELREMPIYALVVAKNGPKLKESAANTKPFVNHRETGGGNRTVAAAKYTMAQLVVDIRSFFGVADRPVFDRTGLAGAYDIKLEAAAESTFTSAPELQRITFVTALQDQLGLKLEAQKEMVEVLVVDRLGKPTAD